MWASGRSSEEFNQGWPSEHKTSTVKKVWGSKEEAADLIKRIEKAHGIKLG